jgi:hypothetical protein
MSAASSHRGSALVVTLLAMGLFSTLAVGLALSASVGRAVAANYEEAMALANACDSALELAARELAAIPDWNEVLGGDRSSPLVDGPPGERRLAGVVIDLEAMTHALTCGRASLCTDAQVHAMTIERPWGANNPRWRLFAYRPSPAMPAMPRTSVPTYVVVWIGDDARETDGDPSRDGAGAGQEGRYVVRARVEAFGYRGGRHAIEAELARVCTGDGEAEVCVPGTRVQSWRAVSGSLP